LERVFGAKSCASAGCALWETQARRRPFKGPPVAGRSSRDREATGVTRIPAIPVEAARSRSIVPDALWEDACGAECLGDVKTIANDVSD
jgi:hypothetical protein